MPHRRIEGPDVSGLLEGRQLYVLDVVKQILGFLFVMEGFDRLERDVRFCIETYADEGMWGGGYDTCRLSGDPGLTQLPEVIKSIRGRLHERGR